MTNDIDDENLAISVIDNDFEKYIPIKKLLHNRGNKKIEIKQYDFGTNISCEITAKRIDFLGKLWILKYHFLKQCLTLSDNKC